MSNFDPHGNRDISFHQLLKLIYRPDEIGDRELLELFGYNSARYRLTQPNELFQPGKEKINSREAILSAVKELAVDNFGRFLASHPEFEEAAQSKSKEQLKRYADEKDTDFKQELGSNFTFTLDLTNLDKSLSELVLLRAKQPQPKGRGHR